MGNLTIKSSELQQAEPLLEKYFHYQPIMLMDEINGCIAELGVDFQMKNSTIENGILKFNPQETFNQHPELQFTVNTDYFKEDITTELANKFNQYFNLNNKTTEDYTVLLSLAYMSYIYNKQKDGLFNSLKSETSMDMYYELKDQEIYKEIMSLYRLVLESHKKKNRDSEITIRYKQDEIKINTASWFLADMERYFKGRFPDVTLDDIDRTYPEDETFTKKAGRKPQNKYANILIWGTYHLLHNHHSAFKDSETKISNEICKFILDYLELLKIETNLILENDVRECIKDMIKRKYTPFWELPINKLNKPSLKDKDKHMNYMRIGHYEYM